MSHPELSSGGGSSLSSGKLSKLLVSVGDATCGGKSDKKGVFIPGLAFPLHPRECPARQESAACTAFCWGISPSSPTLLSFPTHCHKVIPKEPRISHPWLQEAELSPAALKFPGIAQPRDPSRETHLPRMKVKTVYFLEIK